MLNCDLWIYNRIFMSCPAIREHVSFCTGICVYSSNIYNAIYLWYVASDFLCRYLYQAQDDRLRGKITKICLALVAITDISILGSKHKRMQ